MSDLYLVLRRRLDVAVATDWYAIDRVVLHDARKARGLSYEGVARQIPVASKTYERWEKGGRVPRHLLERVAAVLGLEVERPVRQAVTVTDENGHDDERLARLEETMGRVLGRVEELRDLLLEERATGRSAPRAGRQARSTS